nr:hypothetical protein CFP56_05707 [Quercus suber]
MPSAMERKDTEMMETGESSATTMQNNNTSSSTAQNDIAVIDFLTLARQLIDQGKPSQALQAVIMAMRTKGGDEAVFQSLHRARELYRNRLQENAAADQLACLFAECAIAEAQPLKIEPSKVAECKWFWMHSQMGAASFVYNVGVLLVTIAKTSTMPIGVAKPDAQSTQIGRMDNGYATQYNLTQRRTEIIITE